MLTKTKKVEAVNDVEGPSSRYIISSNFLTGLRKFGLEKVK